MPPKKKEKKKKKKAGNDAPSVEEKYQQTLQKIESLQDHLSMRTEISRRSQAVSSSLRGQMKEVNECIEEEKRSKYDISATLKRQYKSLQKELTNKIYHLESKIEFLQENLLKVEEELKFEKEDKMKIIREKDEVVAELRYKIDHMESAYGNILHDAFDSIVSNLSKDKVEWKQESLEIQKKNKELLLEFGLSPLYI